MGAVRALCSVGYLIEPGSVLSLRGPPPGVLASVGKEYICAGDVIPAVPARRLRDSWEHGHVQAGKDSLAVGLPVVDALQE